VVSLTTVASVLTVGQGAPPQAPAGDPTAILAAARGALGGDARIAAVKTFIATGRTRQVRGDNLVPIEFEIQTELPDRYSRRDEIPAQDTGPTTNGFNGDRLIQLPKPLPPPPRAGGPAPPPEVQEAALRARVGTVKQDFARLMLGMFASSYSSFPLTFTYLAQAEAPQGKAEVLEVKGPANFTARLFIHAQTHLPIMVSWEAGGPPGPGRGLPPNPPRGLAPNLAPNLPLGLPPNQPPGPTRGPVAPVENRLYFADYREVDGLQLPFRLRRASGPDTTEETVFDRFRINARVDPRRFEAQ
jgi:hypothetical protein